MKRLKNDDDDYDDSELDDVDISEDIRNFELYPEDRKVYLFGPINIKSILSVVKKIHFLEKLDKTQDIELIINSGGGVVDDTFALIDVMDNSPCLFKIVVLGIAASAACVIAANGTYGKRYCGRYTEFMFHDAKSSIEDVQAADLPYHLKEFRRCQAKLLKIFAKNTGNKKDEVVKNFILTRNDKYMTAYQAKKFGIVDHILPCKKEYPLWNKKKISKKK